jgi:hypothetical protein
MKLEMAADQVLKRFSRQIRKEDAIRRERIAKSFIACEARRFNTSKMLLQVTWVRLQEKEAIFGTPTAALTWKPAILIFRICRLIQRKLLWSACLRLSGSA